MGLAPHLSWMFVSRTVIRFIGKVCNKLKFAASAQTREIERKSLVYERLCAHWLACFDKANKNITMFFRI